jgi:hypothetical protein
MKVFEMSDQRAKPLKERVAEIGKQVLGYVSKCHSVLTNEFSDALQIEEHSPGAREGVRRRDKEEYIRSRETAKGGVRGQRESFERTVGLASG